MKGRMSMHIDERAARSIDLHQASHTRLSFALRSSDAHTFKRFAPQLANLGVTSFKGGADGIAERYKLRALQQDDLRLQQAAALEFEASERHDDCGQPADPQDLSGHRALHSLGQPGGICG